MRRELIYRLLMAAGAICVIACDEDEKTPSASERVKATLLKDTWSITYFYDEQDETFHFAGYILTFNDDGTVAGVNGPTAVNGMWSVTKSDNTTKVVLDFDVAEPFDELNDDWNVIQFTDNLIQLEDVSGGSGETDFLTLEKNP
jgi:hypothetical protein